jgi:hypothetical protein
MPTSCNLLVPSVLATSGDVLPASVTGAAAKSNDIDINIDLDKFINSQTFSPPGARPIRSGKPPTKTQATADQKAEKEAKWKEAEGRKSAAVARRADAKTKAQKAVAKAEEKEEI